MGSMTRSAKVSLTNSRCAGPSGAPERSRTPNLLIRSQALYPIELRAHMPVMARAEGRELQDCVKWGCPSTGPPCVSPWWACAPFTGLIPSTPGCAIFPLIFRVLPLGSAPPEPRVRGNATAVGAPLPSQNGANVGRQINQQPTLTTENE